MASKIGNVLKIILPKGKGNGTGTALTNTYKPGGESQALSAPNYRDHITDLSTSRLGQDSKKLLYDLFKNDSDISATVNAYLTVANTAIRYKVFAPDDQVDEQGQATVAQLINAMTVRSDYSTGFRNVPSLESIAEGLRYIILLRGAIACELIFDKFLIPYDIRQVDPASLKWFETTPGNYTPKQTPAGGGDDIDLNIPTFFVKFYRQNPLEIYSTSPFVSAINTIAARQQVINDLYRIMQKTGYPRLEVKIVEEVLRKSAPAAFQADPVQLRNWVNEQLGSIANSVATMRPDAAYVHTDAVEAKMLNEGGPARAFDVTAIINVLNAQNQAALKIMSTLIGRGESGVNTATVESRVFSMNADSINLPIADLYSDIFTLALRMTGSQSYVVFSFDPVELRPATELEPQLVIRQSRLLQDLSLGIISDQEYTMAMYNRMPNAGAPQLSGTGFYEKKATQAENVSPNSDPLGRSVTPEGSATAKSKGVKK